MDIKGFSLKNGGGFVAHIHVVYRETGNGKEKTFESNDDIPLGQEKSMILSSSDLPDGSIVRLKARVVAGLDNTAPQAFTFKTSATKMARYVITGTTLANELGVIDVS